MEEIQWHRFMMDSDQSVPKQLIDSESINRLKRRVTLIKFKSNGRTYSRIFYLTQTEDAIDYQRSKRRSACRACLIKDITQIRHGFTTIVWKKSLAKRRITADKELLAFSILYDNNRHSLDLLADHEDIVRQWIVALEFLTERYRSQLRTHYQITDRWLWKLFDHADRDHSEKLNRQEVRYLLNSLNIQLEERQMDQYFNEANFRRDSFEQFTSLDKEEFLRFYKYVSYRPELLSIICQFNGNTSEQTAAILADYGTISKLAQSSLSGCQQEGEKLSLPEPTQRQSLLCRPRLTSIQRKTQLSTETMNKQNYLTVEQFQKFLHTEQKMTSVSIEDCARLIARFEPSIEGRMCERLGVDGFRLFLVHDEFCIVNPNRSQRIYHDMTRPLTDYFIATSHNTYLRDNQIYGSCTPEMYIHALQRGCRSVEMDCYDGDNMEPIVYHAKTLTKSTPFHDIIIAIQTQAFLHSPYPLFLNIENHCSYEQQGVMARTLKEIFKDQLLTKPLTDNLLTLPSPEDLKYKVLIRSRRYPKGKTIADPQSNPKNYHPEFARLIIYSQTVSYTNLSHTLSTQKCFHSISLKESKADELIGEDSSELLQLTRKHIVRIYPGMKRQDSSNIHPILYWTSGVQMVALNYQSHDHAMALQDGFFSDNGGCGYLLKPKYLLTETPSFNPRQLQLHLISGQQLAKEKIDRSDILDPYVKISTHGVPCDCSEHESASVRNNGLNPIWDYRVRLDISYPELCLLAFRVYDADRYNRSTFVGQAALSVNTLQSGYRHIKLKDKNGNFILGTLFAHLKIDDF